MLVRTVTLSSLLLLAACAAAIPGYTPPPFKESKLIQPAKSGDVDAEGTYHMSSQEEAIDCRHLKGSMMVTISRMRHREGEVATSQFTLGANKAASSVLGGSAKGLDRDADHARDRARLEAYNRHLASKGCATIDIDAELARPAETPDH
jgi:hypothetical protein